MLSNNNTTNITIETSKHYVVFATLRYNDQHARNEAWIVYNGQITLIMDKEGGSWGELTLIDNSTLQLKGKDTVNTEFSILQLD